MQKVIFGILVLSYLIVVAYFALRPFKPIPGVGYGDASLDYKNGAVQILKGAALEDRRNVSHMRKTLMAAGQMSLLVTLQPDSVSRQRFGWIIAYARNCSALNFELAQEQKGLIFSLLTHSPEWQKIPSTLMVSDVLETNRWQQVVVTYDGSRIRMFLDGRLCGEHPGVSGDFSNWGRDQSLTIGDEPAGGQHWSGYVQQIGIYDRALSDEETVLLHEGGSVSGMVIDYDFRKASESRFLSRNGLKRLHYHNLFIAADATEVQLKDFIANIVGFIPLGFLIYIALPPRIERRRMLSVILIPLGIGFLVSGSIEWMQQYILNRVPSVLDLITNITGTLLGGLFAWLANSSYRKLAQIR